MAKCWVVNVSFAANILWKIIRTFLDPETLAKVDLTRDNTCENLQQSFQPDQLLERYGGAAKEPAQIWPPTMPKSSCAGPATNLVSETEYMLLLDSRPNLARRPDLFSTASNTGSQEEEEAKSVLPFEQKGNETMKCVMTEPDDEH